MGNTQPSRGPTRTNGVSTSISGVFASNSNKPHIAQPLVGTLTPTPIPTRATQSQVGNQSSRDQGGAGRDRGGWKNTSGSGVCYEGQNTLPISICTGQLYPIQEGSEKATSPVPSMRPQQVSFSFTRFAMPVNVAQVALGPWYRQIIPWTRIHLTL